MGIDPKSIGRRRTIQLIAGLGSLPLAGFLAGKQCYAAKVEAFVWQGTALGAKASIEIHHPDANFSAGVAEAAQMEILRLERIFSLYRSDSALSKLNGEGRLAAPPLELLALLRRAALWNERTKGAFDVTLQPLWQLYARHFSIPGADPSGPQERDIAAAKALADHDAIQVTPGEIRFGRPGMAITLNGIAQGFITDRVAEMLHDAGLRHVLINLGEIRVLGNHPEDRPWRVGLKPFRDMPAGTQDISDLAVATSEWNGTTFDASGRFGHILNPRADPEVSPSKKASVVAASVLAEQAMDADALSTALVAPGMEFDHSAFVGQMGIKRIVIGDAKGEVSAFG